MVWEAEDTGSLKRLLEEGEKAKWNFIANELSRVRNKKATAGACQKKIKDLFDQNAASFGIVLNPPTHHHPSYGPYAGTQTHRLHVQSAQQMGMPQGDFHEILQGGVGSQFMGAPAPAMMQDYNMRK